jgi:hypothetical protein
MLNVKQNPKIPRCTYIYVLIYTNNIKMGTGIKMNQNNVK